MAFDVEGALREGYTQEEIDAYIKQNNISLEPDDTPTPQPSPEPTQKPFDVEGALREGYTQEEIDTYLEKKKTFDVEGALKEGYTQKEIDNYLISNSNEDESKRGTFVGGFTSAAGDFLDMADIGFSSVVPGGKDANKAAKDRMKEQQTTPQEGRFSYAAIEEAFKVGGVEGLKELVLQLPGGAGEALGMLGPSVAAGLAGGAIGGPVGALLAIAASSFLPNLGGNVMEQAAEDLAQGRPVDIETGKAILYAIGQAGIDVLPFKFAAPLKRLIGIDKKSGGQLRKQLAEQGLTKAIGKDALAIIASELPAEISQEILQKVQAGVDPFTDEAIAEYKEVAALVTLTGGVGVYTGTKNRSNARKEIAEEQAIEEENKLKEEAGGSDTRQQAINATIKEEQNVIKAEEEVKAAERVKKNKITVIDEQFIKDLGISPKTRAGQQLLGMDLTDPANLEMIDNILAEENLQIKNNKEAVKNFRRKVKRDRKKLLKAQEEIQIEEQPAPKRKRTRARNKVSDGNAPVVTTGTGTSDTTTVDTDRTGTRGLATTTGAGNNTLVTPKVETPKIEIEKKNPLVKGKAGKKAKVGRINNGAVQVIEGVLEDGANGLQLVTTQGRTKITIPLNEQQILNPTKKDLEKLEVKAQEVKPAPVSEVKDKPKTKPSSPERKLLGDTLNEATEEELNAEGYESFTELDEKGNERKRFRNIKTKKPLFAKATTDTERQLAEVRKQKQLAIERADNQRNQDGRVSPAYRKPIMQLQQLEDKLLKQDAQEKKQTTPEQQELFAKDETIPDTGETKQSVMSSFISEFGKNVNLGVKRGLLNIVDTVADLPNSIPNVDVLPNNVKAIYFDGKAYFIADRITKEDAPRMLLHEIGAHYGLVGMLGKANYDRVVKSLRDKKTSDAEIEAAFKYVKDSYPELTESSDDFIQEVIANIAEDAPNNTVYRRIVGYIKNFLSKLGMGWNVDNITAAQIQDMVQHSVRVSLSQPDINPTTQSALASRVVTEVGELFYSPLGKAIASQKIESMSPQEWMDYLNKKGRKLGFVNQLDSTGIMDWMRMLQRRKDIEDKNLPNAPMDIDGFELDSRGRLSKDDILAWLGQYDVVVESITPEGPMSEAEIDNIRVEERERIREEIENNGTYDDVQMEVDEEAGYVDDQIDGVYRIFGSEHRGQDQDFKEEPYAVFIEEELLETEPVRKYYELAQDKGFDVRIVPSEKGEFGQYGAEDRARDYLYETHNPEIEETNRLVEERMAEIVDTRVDDIIEEATQERDNRYGDMQRTRDDTGGVPEEYFEIILALDTRGGNMGNIYESPHWESVQNPVLHIRADIRYDQSGNKVLFVEEVQSDWAESMRKDRSRGYKDARKDRDKAFVEDTQLWTRLAVKRIVRLAAENDVDKVAFLNPAQAVNVHYRTDKAAEAFYGEILPSVVRKTINSLENTNRRTNEEIKFKPIYKVDDKTLDLLREVYVEGKNIMQGSRGYSDFDREDSTPADKERFKRINALVSKLNTMSDSVESFRDIYEFANRVVKITQSYMDNTDLLRPETRKEVLEQLTGAFNKFQEQMANLYRIDDARKEIQRRLAADRRANPDVPMGMNETQKALIERDRELQNERIGAPRPDIRQYNFLNLLIGKGVLTFPELNNRQVGFTMTPKLRQVGKDAMPMFAKQNSKTRAQLDKEIEDGKSAKEKLNDKRRKNNKDNDKYQDDEFFKKNKTIGQKARGFQNAVFGYDIGLYNKLKDRIAEVAKAKNVQEARKYIEDTLAKISTAQAVHAQTLAGAFKELGNIVYKPALEKFEAFKDDNSMHNISLKVHAFTRKYFKKKGIITKADVIQAEKFISQAIVALQFKRIKENNAVIEKKARDLVRQGKAQAAKTLLQQKYVLVEMDDATINKHIQRLKDYPEIKEIQEMWIGVKNNTLDFLLDTEIIDQEQYDAYTQEGGEGLADEDVFIPLYRQGQTSLPRSVASGTTSGRGVFVKRKGTAEPVSNVFLNMDTFVQAAITQGIANKTALNKIRASEEVQEESDLIVRPVKEPTEGFESHAVMVSEIGPDGKQRKQTYEYANEMYAKATNGAAAAMRSGNVFLSNTSTLLRDSIVLNPVFGVAQTFAQDMYSAMYSSGLRYGWLTIPLRVLYEFPATILNLSGTHKELSKYGAVGGYAFKQNDNTIDADINAPGFYNKLIRALSRIPGTNIPTGLTQEGAIQVGDTRLSIGGLLNRIAMASDNSVRQAVYKQALMENKSQRRALEMAFEIINFRKMGDSEWITMGRQYIPFFGAALQALAVQGKTIQGLVKAQSGVTPTTLREARINFMVNYAGTAGVALIYLVLMNDNEEEIMDQFGDMPMSEELKRHLREARRNFSQLDNKIRDRRFIIGDDGFHITLRPDIYTFISKIIPEQVYNTIVAESQDAAKFWLSIKRNLREIISLNLIPQVIRPIIDVMYNEDSRTGRPIVPDRMQDLKPEQQYTPRTSEAAKKIADIIGASPIKVDYFFRQYTGYTGALVSLVTDSYFLENDTNPNRKNKPAVTTRDRIASFPGMTNFYSRDKDNRFMSDYYELKNKASQVAAIFRALDSSPNPEDQLKAQQFLNEGNNRLIYNTNKQINQIQQVLTEIRKERQRIYDYPASATLNGKPMTDERKRQLMLRLDAQEIDALQTVHDLRLRIYGVNPFYNAEKNEYIPGFDSSSFFEKNN